MKKLRDLLPPEVQLGCERVQQAARICDLLGLDGRVGVTAPASRELLAVEDPDERAYVWEYDEPEEE